MRNTDRKAIAAMSLGQLRELFELEHFLRLQADQDIGPQLSSKDLENKRAEFLAFLAMPIIDNEKDGHTYNSYDRALEFYRRRRRVARIKAQGDVKEKAREARVPDYVSEWLLWALEAQGAIIKGVGIELKDAWSPKFSIEISIESPAASNLNGDSRRKHIRLWVESLSLKPFR